MTRVLLLTTGGTIASRRGDQGLEPQISARGLLEYMSDLRAHYHIDARDILNLDSSNIQAEEWQTMAVSPSARRPMRKIWTPMTASSSPTALIPWLTPPRC